MHIVLRHTLFQSIEHHVRAIDGFFRFELSQLGARPETHGRAAQFDRQAGCCGSLEIKKGATSWNEESNTKNEKSNTKEDRKLKNMLGNIVKAR